MKCTGTKHRLRLRETSLSCAAHCADSPAPKVARQEPPPPHPRPGSRWAGTSRDFRRLRLHGTAQPPAPPAGTSPGAFRNLNHRRDITSWLARWFPKTPAKPVVALKTPIKVELVAGKTYRWCVCGHSKKQPFCDGSHFFQRTGLSPLKFKAQETRLVSLCTCKATQKPPYCDGTHRSEQVQKAQVGTPP
ncbi:CDGSH iron-sulfur domain-containing protein 3, mitochondrial isoform X1 [Erinaceus europaeus]|uniref:CDGSH iron-sulfur domain-containing protein 3, mitochondrial isoform X1 n=1 Tax=Erinaceus europaeus TaxID=9365 RepID=A0ABM3YET7_ERIEU|nr:CDGSH iron-sulfur domain-containing protein 3, mitochondrial isoform X1 [Erinaceus europaeus]